MQDQTQRMPTPRVGTSCVRSLSFDRVHQRTHEKQSAILTLKPSVCQAMLHDIEFKPSPVGHRHHAVHRAARPLHDTRRLTGLPRRIAFDNASVTATGIFKRQ
jgi:hypothetical protein